MLLNFYGTIWVDIIIVNILYANVVPARYTLI